MAPEDSASHSSTFSNQVVPKYSATGAATHSDTQSKQSIKDPSTPFPSDFLMWKITSNGPSSACNKWVTRQTANTDMRKVK